MRLGYRERLTKGVVIFDGAMGTMLYNRGIFFNRSFEEVSLTQADLVRKIHGEYVAAGAEAIETNTFGANPRKLAKYGLEGRLEEIVARSCSIAREAAGDDVYVAGSVGPLGAHIEPLGTVTRAQAKDDFRRQFEALLSGGVDLILLETFRSIEELILAAETCRALSADIPIQAQFTVGSDNLALITNAYANAAAQREGLYNQGVAGARDAANQSLADIALQFYNDAKNNKGGGGGGKKPPTGGSTETYSLDQLLDYRQQQQHPHAQYS